MSSFFLDVGIPYRFLCDKKWSDFFLNYADATPGCATPHGVRPLFEQILCQMMIVAV